MVVKWYNIFGIKPSYNNKLHAEFDRRLKFYGDPKAIAKQIRERMRELDVDTKDWGFTYLTHPLYNNIQYLNLYIPFGVVDILVKKAKENPYKEKQKAGKAKEEEVNLQFTRKELARLRVHMTKNWVNPSKMDGPLRVKLTRMMERLK